MVICNITCIQRPIWMNFSMFLKSLFRPYHLLYLITKNNNNHDIMTGNRMVTGLVTDEIFVVLVWKFFITTLDPHKLYTLTLLYTI